MRGFLGAFAVLCLLQEEKGIKDLIEQLGNDAAELREKASQELLARWKRWTLEDLESLAEMRPGDAEVAARSRDALSRIRIRRALGETILKTVDGLESALLTRNEDRLVEALDRVEQLSRKNGLEGADVVSLLRWISEQKWTERIDERIRALAKNGILADPAQILPLLKEEDPVRRLSALETLAKFRARPFAGQVVPLLRDPNPDVRRQASKTLGSLRPRGEGGRIAPGLKEKSPEARMLAAELLASIGARDMAAQILPLLKDPLYTVRVAGMRALAQLRAQEHSAAIVELLSDRNPLVRRVAAEALGDLDATGELPSIESLLGSKEPGVRASAAAALGELAQGRLALLPLMKDTDTEVRMNAVRAIGRVGDRSSAADVRPLLDDAEPWVQVAALEALGRLGNESDSKLILQFSKAKDNLIREKSLEALGRLGDVGQRKVLEDGLKDQDGRVRGAALWALGRLPSETSTNAILELLSDAEPGVREQAVETIGALGASEAAGRIRALLHDSEPRVKKRAIETLEVLRDQDSLSEVLTLLDDPNSYVRAKAALIVGRFGSGPIGARERERLVFTLLAVEKDPLREVELSAGIGLLLLGAKDRPAQLQLIEDLLASGSRAEIPLIRYLVEALCLTYEKKIYETLCAKVTLESAVDSSFAFEQLVKSRGLDLDSKIKLRIEGRFPLGCKLSLLRLVHLAVTPNAILIKKGNTMQLSGWKEALEYWQKRLKG